ncbi:hypothetical protein LV779_29765 [Streptomyces thinghirensis]|nr:hypothetical protein [Streptomyces thinghirensis]
MAAVSAVTAIALGGTAGLAQAAQPAPASTTRTAVTATQQAEAQQAARTLLASPLAAELSAAERSEMRAVADGQYAAAGKWGRHQGRVQQDRRLREGHQGQVQRLQEVVRRAVLVGEGAAQGHHPGPDAPRDLQRPR